MERKMFYGAGPNTFHNARWLRDHTTKHEQLLWEHLRKSQILGTRIKRQHLIGTYIADFYCHAAKLVIEIDGGYHETISQRSYDDKRTFNLELNGLKVIRFSNHDVEHNLDQIVQEITDHIKERLKL